MRFHLLGLAHTITSTEYMPCAYTQKVLKMARMLTAAGHEVIHYGAEGGDVSCEHVTVLPGDVQRRVYGDYDWRKEFFKYDNTDEAYTTFNANAIEAINQRKREGDTLLISWGHFQKEIADAVGIRATIELGIGYSGVFAKYRVFESYAWMHYIYGMTNQSNGSWYDAVIPNYFDLTDFPLHTEKEPYMAFVGRLTELKGVQAAIDLSRATNLPLVVAGQGDLSAFNIDGANVQHIGVVDAKQRAALMGKAMVVLAPTYYVEPFGGVAVEAQLCGTPVITTDWGAFSETVEHGVTGFRCRTFDDMLFALSAVQSLRPQTIRSIAAARYSMNRVVSMYEEYFVKVHDSMQPKGWYELHPERRQLNWLTDFSR